MVGSLAENRGWKERNGEVGYGAAGVADSPRKAGGSVRSGSTHTGQ